MSIRRNNDIDHAHITLTLPGPTVGAGCSVGTGTSERRCVGFTVAGNTVRIEASDLDPHTPITVRASTDVAAPARAYLPWTPRFDGVLGRSVGGLAGPAVLTLAMIIGTRLWLRHIRDGSLPTPVQHRPPEGLGPAQWNFIRTLKVSPDSLTATLLHLADNGLITLTEVNATRWTIMGVADQEAWKRIDGVSRRVGAVLHLTRSGEELNANGTEAAGRRLAAERSELHAAVTSWSEREKLVVSGRRSDVIDLRGCNVMAALAAVALFLPWFSVPSMWGCRSRSRS